VEAKKVDTLLERHTEQLRDYFAKEQSVKLGILTNGVEWRFFTDSDHENIMDAKPFARWDVLKGAPPLEVMTILQKKEFKPENFRTLAREKLNKSRLMVELNRLLEPSNEFMRLVLPTLETRKLTEAVLQSWKPKISAAIGEWAVEKQLQMSLAEDKTASSAKKPSNLPGPPKPEVEMTSDKSRAFDIMKRLLGKARPVAYTNQASYFKVHTPGGGEGPLARRRTVCLLYTNGRRPVVKMPVPMTEVETLVKLYKMVRFPRSGWIAVTLNNIEHIDSLGEVLRITYDRQISPGGDEVSEVENDEGGDSAVLKIA
jgi:hypothetical protein